MARPPPVFSVVTGGASGIGLSISKLFARQGGLVHILDINAAETAAVAESVECSSLFLTPLVIEQHALL
jgi:NAD(P)-dependent dehydrogenase (short-subunit alcohol dehydrogenase family)